MTGRKATRKEVSLTRDQVRLKFDEIIEAESRKDIADKLTELFDLSTEVGPRPNAELPMVVKKLWKS